MKFKRRKAASVKRLEEEHQNLLRVMDILSELEKQVGPLERQAEKAREFLQKKEEQKRLDVNVFLLESQDIRGQIAETEKNSAIANSQLEDLRGEYEKARQEYESSQERISELDAELAQARVRVTDSSVLQGRLEGEIAVMGEKIRSAQSNETHFLSRKQAIETQMEAVRKERDGLQAQMDQIDLQRKGLLDSRDQALAVLDATRQKIASLNDAMESHKNAIIAELDARAQIQSRMGRFDTMREQISLRRAALNTQIEQIRSEGEKQADSLQGLEREFKEATEQIRQLDVRLKEVEGRIGQMREELSAGDRELQGAQARFHQEKSRLDALKNLAERYEGYGGSVRRVMEERERCPGILGVVADLLQVEKKYETAIETALGGNIQNIVTDREDTAREMISFLKKNRGGRATFLPLDAVRPSGGLRQPAILGEKGILGTADSLISTEERYRDVMSSLLGRTVVADNVEHALTVARKYGYSVRMVTLEGELLTPGGAISGGAYANNSNLLGRRREIAALEAQAAASAQAVDRANQKIEDTKQERNRLRTQSEEIRLAQQTAFLRQNAARINVQAEKERQEQNKRGQQELAEEEQGLIRQGKEIEEGKQQIVKELEASREREREWDQKIASCQKLLDAERAAEDVHSRTVNDREREVEAADARRGFAKDNLDRAESELARLSRELSQVEEEIAGGRAEVAQKEEDIQKIRQTIDSALEARQTAKQQLEEGTKAREGLLAGQKRSLERREGLSGQISGLEKEAYRLNAQKERLQETMDGRVHSLWEEYRLSPHEALALREDGLTDLAAMKRDVQDLRDGIRRLGDVNVNAIEEYKSLMERYTFLKTQSDDLTAAEKALNGIIQELDSAMRKQFTEKFAQISQEFHKVFRELFGGGKATLELLEDEDILDAGVRIIAQPPGKKLQNMMQLSGGEKALTAISLLFAIQNLKPSPFCLLDEIEAALDDSNVGRFADYLRKLSGHTQFIVITHRRGTMERADRLYGVTMQEKGVSALVSVSLVEKDLT